MFRESKSERLLSPEADVQSVGKLLILRAANGQKRPLGEFIEAGDY